jgi:hypothetical protein
VRMKRMGLMTSWRNSKPKTKTANITEVRANTRFCVSVRILLVKT